MSIRKTKDSEIDLPPSVDPIDGMGLKAFRTDSLAELEFLAKNGLLWAKWNPSTWAISRRRKQNKPDLGLLTNLMLKGYLYVEKQTDGKTKPD